MKPSLTTTYTLLAVLTAATWCTAADTGSIAGVLTDEATGQPIRRVLVRAFARGQSVATGAMTEGDGKFVIRDLRAGNYAVCVPAGEMHRPVVLPAVTVKPDAVTEIKLQARQSLVIEGDSWLQSYPAFEQSFVATGLGLTLVRIKAFGGPKPITLQLLDGAGPDGRQIGPARTTTAVGGEGHANVLWGGSEAATVPGQTYTLGMSAPEGETWTPGVAGRGNVYPLGSAWFDGSPRPLSDLGILLGEDNDGLRTSYAVPGTTRQYRATSAGQTFIALSESITFAAAELSGVGEAPSYVRFSIHEDRLGGPQIGPSKVVAPLPDAAVAWATNEVPVTPGRTYYLHIETFGNGKFLAGYHPDTYADGAAAFNGRTDAERELAAMIAGGISREDFMKLVGTPNAHHVELANPSFERDALGWKRLGDAGNIVGVDEGVSPMWGAGMFGWTKRKEGQDTRTVVYQHVNVKAGQTCTFSGSILTDHVGGRSSDVKIRLIALPDGGDAVRDDDAMTSSQWYATEGQWRRGSVTFVAQSDTVTVGFDMEQRWSLDASQLYVDGAYFETIEGE